MKNKLNLAAVIALVAMMVAVGCGAQASAEQKTVSRFVYDDGSAASLRVVTDSWSGCKYAQSTMTNSSSLSPLYGTDSKPLGCGEVAK
ncbi:hypothetical protein [Tumebacillus permanentifrigoris]|uniref:Uncharacterized protein n=1 Tax=Tumebacillus permanentifrigoris TaxID=378543 RepID=A0A316D2T1_9BACL|nr:hypothetical protein [Tumebacillus permanentifrigoris]PWK05257.1 hypothetical protein C7459_1246 [Tumebacillus permanentifrigoris]